MTSIAVVLLQVIPLITLILHELEKPAPLGSGIQTIKNELLANMKLRFSNVESDPIFSKACILDPRFKLKPFRNNTSMEKAKQDLLNELEDEFNKVSFMFFYH